MQLQYVSNGHQGAIVSIKDTEGQEKVASAVGSGSIQAIYNSIDHVFGQHPTLTHFKIVALTSGEDAQAEVRVTIEDEATKEQVNGIGVDFDVLQACAKAYVQASGILKAKRGA